VWGRCLPHDVLVVQARQRRYLSKHFAVVMMVLRVQADLFYRIEQLVDTLAYLDHLAEPSAAEKRGKCQNTTSANENKQQVEGRDLSKEVKLSDSPLAQKSHLLKIRPVSRHIIARRERSQVLTIALQIVVFCGGSRRSTGCSCGYRGDKSWAAVSVVGGSMMGGIQRGRGNTGGCRRVCKNK
jgi:hypothetical protein